MSSEINLYFYRMLFDTPLDLPEKFEKIAFQITPVVLNIFLALDLEFPEINDQIIQIIRHFEEDLYQTEKKSSIRIKPAGQFFHQQAKMRPERDPVGGKIVRRTGLEVAVLPQGKAAGGM